MEKSMKKNLSKIAFYAIVLLAIAGTDALQGMNYFKDNSTLAKIMATSTGVTLLGYGISKATSYDDPQNGSSNTIIYAPLKPLTEQERRAEQRRAELDWYKPKAATTLQAFLRGTHVRKNKPLETSVKKYLSKIGATQPLDPVATPKKDIFSDTRQEILIPMTTINLRDTRNSKEKITSKIPDSTQEYRNVIKPVHTTEKKEDFKSRLKELAELGRKPLMTHQEDALKNTIDSLADSVGEELKNEDVSLFLGRESKAIQEGAFLVYQLLIEHKDLSELYKNKTIQEYLKAILDLQSFFYSLCFQIRPDGIGFDEGTFHIDDAQGTLQKFLSGYLNLLQMNGHKLGDPNVGHWFGSNPFAYYRADSHSFQQAFGIDRRFDSHKECEFWFYKFSHILCAFTPQGVWMKPESAGLNTDQVITHAKHYGHSVWSKLKGQMPGTKNHDDDKRNNKERVPQAEKKQFQQLFPELKGNCTLGAMYEYALQQLKQKPNNKDLQKFILDIKKNYPHVHACYNVDPRWGNEIKLTFDEILTACFYTTQEKAVIGFGSLFLDLKRNVLDFKNDNYTFAMKNLSKPGNMDDSFDQVSSQKDLFTKVTKEQALKHLIEQMELFICHEQAVRELFTVPSMQNYFIATAKTLATIIKDKQVEELILNEPLFESNFQQNYLLSEDQKKEAQQKYEQKLKDQAEKIMVDDAKKITLARDIFTIVDDFCTKAEHDLEELCEINTIRPSTNKTIPSIEKIEREIQNMQLRNIFISTVIDATTGIQKTTELRMFEYKTGNHYVPIYDFKERSKKTALIISNVLAGATTKDQQQALIDYCTKLHKTWGNIWNTLCARAEKEGYITSFSPKGKDIIDKLCILYNQKKDDVLKYYANMYIKQSNPSHEYKKLYATLVDDVNNSYRSIESFVRIWFFAETQESNLENLIKGQLNNSIKAFDLQQVGEVESLKGSAKEFLQYKETETVRSIKQEIVLPQQEQPSMFSLAYWWNSK